MSNQKSNKSNKGASKSKAQKVAPVATREGANKEAPALKSNRLVFAKRRDHDNKLARTTKIEIALMSARRPLTCKEVESAVGADVLCVRNHLETLRRKLMLTRDEQNRYCVVKTIRTGAVDTIASDKSELGAHRAKEIAAIVARAKAIK